MKSFCWHSLQIVWQKDAKSIKKPNLLNDPLSRAQLSQIRLICIIKTKRYDQRKGSVTQGDPPDAILANRRYNLYLFTGILGTGPPQNKFLYVFINYKIYK